jgi:pimeloyl-ACP methyl ester carboxylesterase
MHLAICISLAGCNSVFYQPDSIRYGDPASLGFALESRQIETRSQAKIDAILLRAVGKKKGTVVHFHGNAQNMTAHLGFTYWIPEHGFDLYIFDYQGYGASQGSPSRQGTIDDGVAVLQDALRLSDGKPVFVLGQSLGAAVGFVSTALTPPQEVCALVFESGFDSYRLVVRDKLSDIWFMWPFQYPLSYLFTDEYAPRDYVDRMRQPILFLHGAADHVVPLSSGKRLYDAYQGPVKKWIELPGAGHTPFLGDPKSSYRRVVIDFLEESSKGCAGAPR